jgi:hypothetical protein
VLYDCWMTIRLLIWLQKTYPLKGGKVATLQVLAFKQGTKVLWIVKRSSGMSLTMGEDLAEMTLWSVVQLGQHLVFWAQNPGFYSARKVLSPFLGPRAPWFINACKRPFQSLLLNDGDVRRFVLWMVRSIHLWLVEVGGRVGETWRQSSDWLVSLTALYFPSSFFALLKSIVLNT